MKKLNFYQKATIVLAILVVATLVYCIHIVNESADKIDILNKIIAPAWKADASVQEMYETLLNNQQTTFNYILAGIAAFSTLLIGSMIAFNLSGAKNEIKQESDKAIRKSVNKFKEETDKKLGEAKKQFTNDIRISSEAIDKKIKLSEEKINKCVSKEIEERKRQIFITQTASNVSLYISTNHQCTAINTYLTIIDSHIEHKEIAYIEYDLRTLTSYIKEIPKSNLEDLQIIDVVKCRDIINKALSIITNKQLCSETLNEINKIQKETT